MSSLSATAALQARESGAQTMLVDRFGGGGTTKYSGGVIYAGNTRFQKQAGFDDDVPNMLAYLRQEIGDVVQPETLRRFCEESAGDIDWLARHGVEFSSEAYLGKTTFLPEGTFLYYSGNEKLPVFAAHARPVPRGHPVVGPGYGGAHYIAALSKALDCSAVALRLHASATRLVTDQGGRVVGVKLRRLPQAFHAEHQKLYEKASPWLSHNNAAA